MQDQPAFLELAMKERESAGLATWGNDSSWKELLSRQVVEVVSQTLEEMRKLRVAVLTIISPERDAGAGKVELRS
jgi:hypothetical protein